MLSGSAGLENHRQEESKTEEYNLLMKLTGDTDNTFWRVLNTTVGHPDHDEAPVPIPTEFLVGKVKLDQDNFPTMYGIPMETLDKKDLRATQDLVISSLNAFLDHGTDDIVGVSTDESRTFTTENFNYTETKATIDLAPIEGCEHDNIHSVECAEDKRRLHEHAEDKGRDLLEKHNSQSYGDLSGKGVRALFVQLLGQSMVYIQRVAKHPTTGHVQHVHMTTTFTLSPKTASRVLTNEVESDSNIFDDLFGEGSVKAKVIDAIENDHESLGAAKSNLVFRNGVYWIDPDATKTPTSSPTGQPTGQPTASPQYRADP